MDANFQAISTLLQTGDIYHIQNFETTTLWTCKLNEVFIQGDVKIALQELSTEDPAISPSLFFNFFDYYGFFWLNFFFLIPLFSGTHYVSEIWLGGSLSMDTIINNTIQNTSFLGDIGGNVNLQLSLNEVYSLFF